MSTITFKQTFINKYLQKVNYDLFKRQYITYVDIISKYKEEIKKYRDELHSLFTKRHRKDELLNLIKEHFDLIDDMIKLLLDETFQEILKDLYQMEDMSKSYIMMETQFIDACKELIKMEWLTSEIYTNYIKSGDLFSSCGNKVRIRLNKDFLEKVGKKINFF